MYSTVHTYVGVAYGTLSWVPSTEHTEMCVHTTHGGKVYNRHFRKSSKHIYVQYRIAGKFRDFVQNQTFRGFNFAISNLQNISLAGKLLS